MFDNEHNRTTQKMADTVMEYASQFVARGYLDEYDKAQKDTAGAYLSGEFDDNMYRLILKEVKWQSGRIWRITSKLVRLIVAVLLTFCVAFTAFVLLSPVMREALVSLIKG